MSSTFPKKEEQISSLHVVIQQKQIEKSFEGGIWTPAKINVKKKYKTYNI